MCGINGIFHYDFKQVNKEKLIKMRDALEHRGPDDAGIFIDNNIGLGHRRLSIIDTSLAGHQPFLSDNGRYVIVFNGEIYNYESFYPEIKSKGLVIKTKTDTEVLLKLYEIYGLDMLERLNGMFAFALWDKLEKKLILARDRMGVKPLFYSKYQNTLFFASEQKALFKAGVPVQISENGLEEYFFNRFVAGENTLYTNINKVAPGHYLTIYENGTVKNTQWWNLKEQIQNHEKIIDPKKWLEETFYESVQLRMVSDVPVGVLLSGGLDSCSILSSLYHQEFKNIETFNIGFSDAKHNESFLAKKITEDYNYNFNTLKTEGIDLYQKLIQATRLMDEPIMHLNEPHLLAISGLAYSKVKVLLSGEGADELMGGYKRYKALQYPTLLKAISYLNHFDYLANNPKINKLLRYSKIKEDNNLIVFNSTSIYPDDINLFYGLKSQPVNEYRYKILEDAKEIYPNNLKRQALYFDQHTYLCSLLDRNDRCTMGASIECREPFLDQRLVAGIGTLDDKWLFSGKKGKFVLKSIMAKKLPKEILNFKKIGLSVPWDNYLAYDSKFREELDSFARSNIFTMPFLENLSGQKIVDQILKGNKNIIPYIMPLFMLHIWEKSTFEKLV